MTPRMYKIASSVIEMGDPIQAGKGIAQIIKFLMERISIENRRASISKLRDKIWFLNEQEISSKKTPESASMGQSITFVKTILNGHNPDYVRTVLENIVRNLY